MRFIIIISILLGSLQTNAQVSEASSGKNTFSIGKKSNSGKIHFNVRTVSVSDSASNSLKSNDKQGPIITITSPLDRGIKLIELSDQVTIKGLVEDSSTVALLTINGVEVNIDDEGNFRTDMDLAYGLNIFRIKAFDVHQNSSFRELKVFKEQTGDKAEILTQSEAFTWIAPLSNQEVSNEEYFTAQVCIETDHVVKKVEYFLDGFKVATVLPQELKTTSMCSYTAEKRVHLKLGSNSILVQVVTDREIFSSVREIQYQPRMGRQLALIIAVEQYDDSEINNLNEPLNDAMALKEVLLSRYGYEDDNIIFLNDPVYADMINTLHQLRTEIKESDDLIIFYAGHGYWDEEMKNGYWLPRDAEADNPGHWLSNDVLASYLRVLKAKHILLVADACFSGGIFQSYRSLTKDQSMNKLYELTSRKAMTSGTLNLVPDQSVFMHYLLKALNENDEEFLSAGQLFSRIRLAVLNNGPNVPQYGTIQNVGDEGGDFIFSLRSQ